MLILSFFNAHLEYFPYDSYEHVLARFVALSFRRCVSGGRPAVIMVLAWTLQCVSVLLACLSLVETFPWNYYSEYYRDAEVYIPTSTPPQQRTDSRAHHPLPYGPAPSTPHAPQT